MRINEVMKETGLTKKAIYYYESEGLIRPLKDPDNNYRDYTGEEVRKLIVINVLRRLDVPIKAIGDIINHSVPVKDVLKEQLVLTNQKINILFQNKLIMNDLIQKDIDEKDFSLKTLKEFNHELDKLSQGSGHAGKELERIFPGTLGKICAIFYSNYLNVSLDTEEKKAAWKELIQKIDIMKEVDFPDEIKIIVDELYCETDEEKLNYWEKVSRPVIKEIAVRQDSPSRESITVTQEQRADYDTNMYNLKKIEGYYKLQGFIINNLEVFMEIDRYVVILNPDYRDYRKRAVEGFRFT